MGVNTTLHCANIICSIVCHAISYYLCILKTLVVVASWMGGRVCVGASEEGNVLLLSSCIEQYLGECWLACPGSCSAQSLAGVLAVVCVAHLVCADL